MREIFKPSRRLAVPALREDRFTIDPPPELPRTIPVKAIKKALPFVFGGAIIGMMVMMFISGIRQMNPMYLFFMAMMALGLFQSVQQQGGTSEMSTEEVDSERAEYQRYLSATSAKIREAADSQRRNAEWSHPDPGLLEAAIDESRMWERGRSDPDYLQIRVGRTEVALANQVKVKPMDSDLDLEPVTYTALQHMRAVQQSIPHCPKVIDLSGLGRIDIYGDREVFTAAVSSWISQLVTWHTPTAAAVAVASPRLESQWGWVKWLPHTESGDDLDGVGPARLLATSLTEVEAMVASLVKNRAELLSADGTTTAEGPTKTHKHLVIVVDDPEAAPRTIRRLAALDGVTVIVAQGPGQPDPDFAAHDRQLSLSLDKDTDGAVVMREWRNFGWIPFCSEPDLIETTVVQNLARLLAKWDIGVAGRQNSESQLVQGLLSLLRIDNAAHLNVAELWADRPLEQLLRVPIGLQPGGAPLYVDFKDEADGGNGPHGLMIGMTGSGKSKTLTVIIFLLLLKHSPDVVQVLLGDFKDEAGMDAFAGYPHTVGIVSNMEEKRSLVERFGETLFGILDARGRHFKTTGQAIKGAAFEKISEYNEARATTNPELPPVPYLFVIVDEFSLMLNEHKDMADVFDVVTRKGRSYGMYFLFASQTLDEGAIKKIPDNTQYRFGLKVASPSISRRIIGTEEAYHIPDGKQHKGTGYFVRAPGAEPVKFRSFLLPDRYEPPVTVDRKVTKAKARVRTFTASPVERDPDTVVEEIVAGTSVLDGPPRSLVLTVGPQLAAHWGKPPSQLWSPPLDDPIPLDTVLSTATTHQPPNSAVPWWPLGEIDRPRALSHGLLTYTLSQGHISLMGMTPSELSTVAVTFVLSAAARYSPREIGFYALSYGGSELAVIKDLPHVGAVGGRDRRELTGRIFGDLQAVMSRRRRLFRDHDVASMDDYRRRRAAGEAALDDGYPVDMFLIIDGWENFTADNTSQMHPKNPQIADVESIIGADQGLHVLITSADWITLGVKLQSRLSCKWELKMAASAISQIRPRPDQAMRRPQDLIPAGQPGRGVDSNADVIRFAVGRLDGQPTMDDLDAKAREAVAEISARYAAAGRATPRPQLLPTTVEAAQIDHGQLAGEQFALGLRGSDLAPLVIDFAEEPLLAVYGDGKTGRTTLVRNLLRTVVARRAGDTNKAIVCVFDVKRRLKEETRFLIEGEDYYEEDPTAVAERLMALHNLLSSRTPPKDLGWEARRSWTFQGPNVWVFIDDLDAVATQVQVNGIVTQTWNPLTQHLANARQIGLRVIMTHKAAGAFLAESTPISVSAKIASNTPNRILLGSREKDKVGGVPFEDGLPPGRGFVIAARSENGGYVQLASDPSAE